MPIDPRMVKWDEPDKPDKQKIDPRMVKWEEVGAGPTAIDQPKQAGSWLAPEIPIKDLAAGALRGAGSIGATWLLPIDMVKQKLRGDDFWSMKDNRERRKQMDEGLKILGVDTDSVAFKVGKIAGEVAGTAGAGGALGNAVRGISSSPKAISFADALANYGLGSASKGVGYIPRIAAGAAAGGGAAALVNPSESLTGAGVGAALPAVAPVAVAGGRIVSNLTGPFRESWRTAHGRKYFDEMLGSGGAKQKAIQAIASGKGAGNSTVANDIATANLGQTDKFASPLVAIEDRLATQAGGLSDTAKSIVARQEAGRMSTLESVKPDFASAKAARKAVTKPMRETELSAANIAGVKLPQLESKIKEKLAQVIHNLQTTGKAYSLAGMEQKNLKDAIGSKTPGWISTSKVSGIEDRLIGTRQATEASNAMKWQRQDEGGFLVRQAESIAAHGLKPLESNSVISGIDKALNAPGPRASDLVQKSLVHVKNKIESLTDKNGVIDARDLYTVRKELGNVISQFSKDTGNWDKKLVSGMQNNLQSAIDDAIVGAGGTGWKDYLTKYGELSKPVNQSKVIQAMQDVLSGQGGAERASAFQNVMGRGESALLKKSTGFPRYTGIDQVLNRQQLDAVKKVSTELASDMERARLGSNIDTKHLFTISEKGADAVSFPTLLTRPAMLANWVKKKVGQGADEMITQDIGKLMISDPAAFSAKYLQDVHPSLRKQVMDVFMKQYGTPMIGATSPITAVNTKE